MLPSPRTCLALPYTPSGNTSKVTRSHSLTHTHREWKALQKSDQIHGMQTVSITPWQQWKCLYSVLLAMIRFPWQCSRHLCVWASWVVNLLMLCTVQECVHIWLWLHKHTHAGMQQEYYACSKRQVWPIGCLQSNNQASDLLLLFLFQPRAFLFLKRLYLVICVRKGSKVVCP